MPGMVHFAQHVSPSFQLTDVGDGVGKARERQETPAISVLIRGWTFRWPTFNSHHQNQMMLIGFAGLGFAFRHSRRKVSFA
jgi:hypothetical protein